ncbi:MULTISPECIES: DUF6624 domain-containing protein [Flavobacteriaceae]|uniref:DUF6624 domain-containing protein n=1 Tax=Flavobacteriaceae TaxID=49546 RepID=UPI0015C91B8D|nr:MULTISPECIES: DUF6624 domain-containing protein [Winogradskyella]MBU2929724.1 hypothetical protein [Winogradskyella psychrotolerans]
MNYKIYFHLLLAMLISSCNTDKKYVPDDLRKLTESDQIEIAEKRKTYNYDNVIFKNEKGETISADSMAKISSDIKYAYDTYFNDKNQPEIVVIREANQKDKDLRKQIIEIYKKEIVEPIKLINIDCSEIQNILTNVHSLDQDMRKNGKGIDPKIDRDNLVKVVSIIEKCGMPSLENVSTEQMSTIWLVFQHADNFHRKKYLPQLKESAENGNIRKSQIALMEDRILMMDGKPQIYGSQISKNQDTGEWMIYDLKEPENVDKRRTEVGLGPLSEYVKNWNIEFNVEQSE